MFLNLKIYENEAIPCDILILTTSNPKGNCFIETKTLDGETNLKLKNTPMELQNLYSDNNNFNVIILEKKKLKIKFRNKFLLNMKSPILIFINFQVEF